MPAFFLALVAVGFDSVSAPFTLRALETKILAYLMLAVATLVGSTFATCTTSMIADRIPGNLCFHTASHLDFAILQSKFMLGLCNAHCL
jgi:hypothetical protein